MPLRARPKRLHRLRAALPVLLLLTFALSTLVGARRSDAQTARGGAGTIVFAVQRHESGATIDPVAFVRPGRYTAPPSGGDGYGESKAEAARARRFIRDYFRAGRKYRLLFGGGEAGSVEVRKYLEPGCVGMEASARVETSVKLGGQVLALATDSNTLGRKTGTRRAPTENERAAALELARQTFQRNRVDASRVVKMETNNLTAIDMNRRATMLIGSFLINGEYGVEDAVLLIAEPSGAAGGNFQPTLAWFHHGQEAEAHYRRLVDVLDLDGDGSLEVIAEGIYYESHDYFIYKKQDREGWQVAYQGGGGGC